MHEKCIREAIKEQKELVYLTSTNSLSDDEILCHNSKHVTFQRHIIFMLRLMQRERKWGKERLWRATPSICSLHRESQTRSWIPRTSSSLTWIWFCSTPWINACLWNYHRLLVSLPPRRWMSDCFPSLNVLWEREWKGWIDVSTGRKKCSACDLSILHSFLLFLSTVILPTLSLSSILLKGLLLFFTPFMEKKYKKRIWVS